MVLVQDELVLCTLIMAVCVLVTDRCVRSAAALHVSKRLHERPA